MLATVGHYQKYIAAKLKYYRCLDVVEELLAEAEPLLWQKWARSRRRRDIEYKKKFAVAYKKCCRQMTRVVAQWVSQHSCDDTLCESYAEKLNELAALFLENGKITAEMLGKIMLRKPKARLELRYKNKAWDRLGKPL